MINLFKIPYLNENSDERKNENSDERKPNE